MGLLKNYAHVPLPNKLKIAVSGCPLDCAESHVRAIGILGGRKGFVVELGGSAGASPRVAEVVARDLSGDETDALVGTVIDAYRELGMKKRLGDVIEKDGIEAFKARVGL